MFPRNNSPRIDISEQNLIYYLSLPERRRRRTGLKSAPLALAVPRKQQVHTGVTRLRAHLLGGGNSFEPQVSKAELGRSPKTGLYIRLEVLDNPRRCGEDTAVDPGRGVCFRYRTNRNRSFNPSRKLEIHIEKEKSQVYTRG